MAKKCCPPGSTMRLPKKVKMKKKVRAKGRG